MVEKEDILKAIKNVISKITPYHVIHLGIDRNGIMYSIAAVVTPRGDKMVVPVYFTKISPNTKLYREGKTVYSNDVTFFDGVTKRMECHSFTLERPSSLLDKEKINPLVSYLQQLIKNASA